MKTIKVLCFLLIICFECCIQTEEKSFIKIDTNKIMQQIFEDKLFLSENIRANADTLYLLRTKYINDSWPKKTKHFNLKYIDSTSRATIVNFGPYSPYDGRTRLSVLRFDQSKDTLNILILSHGDQVFFSCSLVADSNKVWKLLETEVDNAGRRAKYEFEEEQWYKDWLKKTRAQKTRKND